MMHSNPFSTKFVQPGAIDYVLPEGTTWDKLLKLFIRNQLRGQVVGPHGVGKSTFLCSFLLHLSTDTGIKVTRINLQANRRDWSLVRTELAKLPAAGQMRHVLVIDGFEQLNMYQRWYTRWRTHRAGSGLLVTVHQAERKLPLLFHASHDWQRFQSLVAKLLSEHSANRPLLDKQTIASVYQQHATAGNLREVLFELYDQAEQNLCSSRTFTTTITPRKD
ncbi:MAG: AAA family ATPase [Pirellulaceae bacterium]